jgi:hypothetical protein
VHTFQRKERKKKLTVSILLTSAVTAIQQLANVHEAIAHMIATVRGSGRLTFLLWALSLSSDSASGKCNDLISALTISIYASINASFLDQCPEDHCLSEGVYNMYSKCIIIWIQTDCFCGNLIKIDFDVGN